LQLKRNNSRLPFNPSGEISSSGTLSRFATGDREDLTVCNRFFLIIQLIGSAPSVSNFASYSGVLIVISRLAAAVTLAAGPGVADALSACRRCWVVVELADGEGVAPLFYSAADRNKKFHATRIAMESTNASKSFFVASL
jgi:hypothetical protein